MKDPVRTSPPEISDETALPFGTDSLRSSAVRHLLEITDYFIPRVSSARMSRVLSGEYQPEKVVVGSGCVHTDGVSAGVPIDAIGFYSAAALMAQATGLNKLIVLIAPAIAKANENINLNDEDTALQLAHIESWHTYIANTFKGHCSRVGIEVEIVKDRDLMEAEQYYVAQQERLRACFGAEEIVCPYSEWQDLIFRSLQTMHGAGIKVGWTPHNDASIAKAYPHIFGTDPTGSVTLAGRLAISKDKRVQGACEVAFDTNTRALWPDDPIQACYIPSALTLDGKTVAPYTAKPRPGSKWHGRILLAQSHAESLSNTLYECALKHPDVLRGFMRQCQTIHSAFPVLGVGVTAAEESQFLSLLEQRTLHVDQVKAASIEDQKAKLSERARRERSAGSNREFAEVAASIIAPKLETLIRTFGI
jgi:hypothetical protein